MQRRNFIRLAGGGTIAAATLGTLGAANLGGCSNASEMPIDAIEAWNGPSPELAKTDVRRWLISYAILAPHSHNLQSWVVDLGKPNEIWLYCDLQRLLPQTDPLSRQIMMSHGTFLELLDLAARERGLRTVVQLFPEGSFSAEKIDTRAVARIQLAPDTSVKPDPLFAQILRRHTNRNLYDPARPASLAAWQAMDAAVRTAGVRMGYVSVDQGDGAERALAQHRSVAEQAWRIELTTPRTIMESFDVLRVGSQEIAQHRDGLSLLDPKVVWLNRLGLFDRSKAPAADDFATTSQLQEFGKKIASTPSFMWMVTQGNDRATQVQAGRAYARVQLAATAQGLVMQPLSQALQEYPEQQKPYADIHALVGAKLGQETVQMWARVGYATPTVAAPRRRLKDFIRA